MGGGTITVFDPTPPKRKKASGIKKHSLDLRGKRLAVVWNRKLGGDILLDRFSVLLTERLGLAGVEKADERGDGGKNLDKAVVSRLASMCDAAILGTGD